MRGLAFVAALVCLPLFGWGAIPRRVAAWLPVPAGIAVAAALGALFLAVEMLAMSFLSIRWTAWGVAAIPLFLTALRASRVRLLPGPTGSCEAPKTWPRTPTAAALGIVSAMAVCAYASLTTRATSADLLFFWGTKAERFANAGGIDVAFLKDPNHWAVHTDYPPLLPCLWAFASLCAGRFPWGASLATLPIAAGFLILGVWGFARRNGDERGAAWAAALVGAMAAATWLISGTAGNADPVLIFLEGSALLVVVFAGDEPGAPSLSGALLAGAVLTKFEGTFFAGALAVASLVVQPRAWRRAVTIAMIPVGALAFWIAFCRARGLLSFIGKPTRLYIDASRVGIVSRGLAASASYGAAYLPWIVVAALLLLAKPLSRRRIVALAAALLILAADFLIYFVSPADPTMWVGWSGSRLLLTPLLCLYVAAADGLAGAGVVQTFGVRTRTGASESPAA